MPEVQYRAMFSVSAKASSGFPHATRVWGRLRLCTAEVNTVMAKWTCCWVCPDWSQRSTVALHWRHWQVSRSRVNVMNGHSVMGHVLGWNGSFKSSSLHCCYGQFDSGISQVADVSCWIRQPSCFLSLSLSFRLSKNDVRTKFPMKQLVVIKRNCNFVQSKWSVLIPSCVKMFDEHKHDENALLCPKVQCCTTLSRPEHFSVSELAGCWSREHVPSIQNSPGLLMLWADLHSIACTFHVPAVYTVCLQLVLIMKRSNVHTHGFSVHMVLQSGFFFIYFFF